MRITRVRNPIRNVLFALSAFAALTMSGCRSLEWNNRIKDTPENWAAIKAVATKSGFKVTYVRERDLATRRSEHGNAVGALVGLAGDRVVAKRRGEWIFLRVERWNRVGAFAGQGWDLRALVPETEEKLWGLLRKEPNVQIAEWREVHSDKNLLDEGTVDVPSNAPEHGETENLIFR